MPHHHAAASAEGQTVDVRLLGQIPGGPVRHAIQSDRGIADRQPADLRGGRRVSLDERRRDAEYVRNVVEAGSRVVGRQQGGGVDFERQQIADDVRILRPIQPVERRRARVRPAPPRSSCASSRDVNV